MSNLDLLSDGSEFGTDAAEGDALLTSDPFQFGEAKLHGQDGGVEGIAEELGLFGLTPVGEVGVGGVGVFNDEVMDVILKIGGPGEDALDTGRVWGDDTDGGEGDAA